MKTTEEEIIEFLKEETFEDEITPETDVFNDCGVSGDDCDELLNAYQKKYNVDMSEYLWYFHHRYNFLLFFHFLQKYYFLLQYSLSIWLLIFSK